MLFGFVTSALFWYLIDGLVTCLWLFVWGLIACFGCGVVCVGFLLVCCLEFLFGMCFAFGCLLDVCRFVTCGICFVLLTLFLFVCYLFECFDCLWFLYSCCLLFLLWFWLTVACWV